MKSYAILHCPYNWAGNPGNLARAERKLGLKSWAVDFGKNFYAFKCDEVIGNKPFFIREYKRWVLLFTILFKFDIVHFNAGSSLMPDWSINEKYINSIHEKIHSLYIRFFVLKDLCLLKIFRKGIVVTFQGDDARQRDYCKEHFEVTFVNDVPENYYSPSNESFKKWKITMFEKYADRIYALNPDLLYVLPKKAQFLPYGHVNIDEWQPNYLEGLEKRSILVVHAPTNRAVKGTKYIIKAVERLKKEGYPIQFVLVENMTNEKAKEIYKKADILIDQLLAGWYGGLAVELMALGKPVMAYIRKEDLKFIPAQMRDELPVINVTPNTIYQVLKKYITTDKNKLVSIGKKSRQYVERWHDPIMIAKRLKNDYEKIMKKN